MITSNDFILLLLGETDKVTQEERKRYKLPYVAPTHFESIRKSREERKKREKTEKTEDPLGKEIWKLTGRQGTQFWL